MDDPAIHLVSGWVKRSDIYALFISWIITISFWNQTQLVPMHPYPYYCTISCIWPVHVDDYWRAKFDCEELLQSHNIVIVYSSWDVGLMGYGLREEGAGRCTMATSSAATTVFFRWELLFLSMASSSTVLLISERSFGWLARTKPLLQLLSRTQKSKNSRHFCLCSRRKAVVSVQLVVKM